MELMLSNACLEHRLKWRSSSLSARLAAPRIRDRGERVQRSRVQARLPYRGRRCQ